MTDSYYQFYQPNFPNPNPNPNPIDPHTAQWQPVSASAPPFADPNYPHDYPPYHHHTSDHFPLYPQNPNPQFSYDPNPNPSPIPPYSGPPVYGSYEDTTKYDRWGGGSHGYGYGDDGAYKYDGGDRKPYGSGGGFDSMSSSSVMFDDYGRPINVSNGNGGGGDRGGSNGVKMVKAVPKTDLNGGDDDVKGGVQKFRVKVLSEGYGQNDLDVLCEIGLDGIRMLDPATNRTLRIYPLETVTRWEVLDSYIFAFWAKMPVDNEPKRIRMKSNSYTTNTILDIVTAASVQVKEIGEQKDPNSFKTSQLNSEKKKGFVDWMNLIKLPNEEKDHWVPDEAVNKCSSCGTNFNAFVRRHHCRNCGEIFCDKCTQGRTPLTADEDAPAVRVCDQCLAEVTQRLVNGKETANGNSALLRHEDLAKKLKEEMSRNSKVSSAGSKSEGSQKRTRDVACPTCTVHLQVEIPTSGSETIECSVCQHPFLVSAD